MNTFSITPKKGEEGAVDSMLAKHLEAVIYNITGIAMAIALVNQSFKIETKYLASVRKYIETSCANTASKSKQRGGTSMPSDYFGYKHPNFSEWNAGNQTNVSEIRFDEGIARSEMGGGGHMISFMVSQKPAKTAIKAFLKQHQVTIDREALHELLVIIDAHVNCLANDLKAAAAQLGEKQVAKVMKLKRHAVFH